MLIPLWAFITLQSVAGLLALLAITLIARAWLRRKDLQTRRCYRCHYDLSATSGPKCPECGREAKSEAELLGKRRRWRSTRRAAIPLVAAALVCFAGFFAAWPVRMMPTWMLVRCTPWMVESGGQLRNEVCKEWWIRRSVSAEHAINLIRIWQNAWRSDPPPTWADDFSATLLGMRADLTAGRSVSSQDADREGATRGQSSGESSWYWMESPSVFNLLTEKDQIELIETLVDADRRSIDGRIGAPYVTWLIARDCGPQVREWLWQHYFSPSSDWAWLDRPMISAMDTSDPFAQRVIDQLSSPDDSVKRRAAAVMIRVIQSRPGSIDMRNREPFMAQLQSLRRRSKDIKALADSLLIRELDGLHEPTTDAQVQACLTVMCQITNPIVKQAVAPLSRLASESNDERVKQTARSALRMIASQYPELSSEITPILNQASQSPLR